MFLWKILFPVSECALIDYCVVISFEILLDFGWAILKESGRGKDDFYFLHLNAEIID